MAMKKCGTSAKTPKGAKEETGTEEDSKEIINIFSNI